MLYLIVFIFIFLWIYKNYNNTSSSSIITILQRNGFNHISLLQQNQTSYMLSADFHGENYLFQAMTNNAPVSLDTVHSLIEYMTKNHYHNVILILGNSIISDSAMSEIKKYNIEVWNNSKLKEVSKPNTETSTIISQMPLNDTCKIDEAQDPIQDGTKANSILGNLLGNKIERL